MKVTIKTWNAVASWRWDMPEDDVCGICRVQFDGTCPTCKYPGDDCTLRKQTPPFFPFPFPFFPASFAPFTSNPENRNY